ncbi:MAG TPA: ATP-dependent 6-phosphofructokinase [Exilispira sp.]|mgnify:FL=1|nr:ATP-dependent 6-phosphofructokinase [Exilispira sp.]
MEKSIDFNIKRLGKPIYFSPMKNINFIDDSEKIFYDVDYSKIKNAVLSNNENDLIVFEKAGPRENIFFDPKKTTAGIVTCGGLCPGLNNVIRSLVLQLIYQYGINKIIGFRYGYRGIDIDNKINPIFLDVSEVADIHNLGGSYLGSSRGATDNKRLVDSLLYYGIDILFTIGGDGTIRGAMAIEEEVSRRNLPISVINIPKTIDNDIPFISKSFGFQTAVAAAQEAIRCAHNEAKGAPNGIGIVKLMGRDSGFIAAQAALAQKDANYVLVPEIDFNLVGHNGLLASLERRLTVADHALIVVAEGSGQKFFDNSQARYDKSGNKKLEDIGLFLKNKISKHFEEKGIEVNIKYIDPSYMIRSVVANAEDAVYCGFLAEHAVHAAMSGRTRLVIGKWNDTFIHLPMDIVSLGRKKIDPKSSLWQSVLLSTGQPSLSD